MCRLFGLQAGPEPVAATFWLLDAPDSLLEQSHHNPDGAGIGVFAADGTPVVDKQPLAAWSDPEFATAARTLRSRTFLAHVRYASTGAHTVANTHPFVQSGRLFAHNGVVEGLSDLDARLAALDASGLVGGQTDSERVFALITAETARSGGDPAAGIAAAVSWLAAQVPVYALNFVLSTPDTLWALRYPDTHGLYLLERDAGAGRLDQRSDRIHARSGELADRAAVVVASEPLDGDAGWREIASGELVRIGADLAVHTTQLLTTEPRHRLTPAELSPQAAASQHPLR